MSKIPWHVIAVLLLVAISGGCSLAPGDAPESEPAIGSVSVITVPEQVVFPIDIFVPTIDQRVAIASHDQFLVNECAAAHGSSGRFVIGVESGEQDDLTAFRDLITGHRRNSITRNGLWGSFDPVLMRQQGYASYPSNIPYGYASGGSDSIFQACMQAVSTVSPFASALMPFLELPDGGLQYHLEDSRWVAVVEKWSACMTVHGFSYANPREALGANAYAAADPDASAQDKADAMAVAIADLDCKLETNLIGQGVAIQSAYDQIYIDSHRGALADMQAQIAAYLVTGVEILPDLDTLVPATPETS
ncbi:MAG: hypothetical protein LBJ43_06670 [Propionibacteriaceae bacterium]|jgi:hypothetical protein|nr:hypothetical protein [Propionibacteriaceae bacterium]